MGFVMNTKAVVESYSAAARKVDEGKLTPYEFACAICGNEWMNYIPLILCVFTEAGGQMSASLFQKRMWNDYYGHHKPIKEKI